MKYFLGLCLSLLSLRCSSGDLPDSFRLNSFRVLAILSSSPEVNPGDTVTLTPLLSDIDGNGRAITFSAQGCIDPGIGFGAEPSCDASASLTTLATDQPVTGLASPNYTGLLTSTLNVTVPVSGTIFDQRTPAEQFNGVTYLVTYQFKVSATQIVRAFKRILVSTRTKKNQNPLYTSNMLQTEQGDLTSLPTSKTPIHADLDPASNETYDEQQTDGSLVSRTERNETFWFISDGDLTITLTENSDATKYTPPTTLPTSHQVVVVVVTLDQRGGAAALVTTY